MKAKLDKLKKKFGVGQQDKELHPKEKVTSEDYGFSQTTFEFFNENKRVGILNTSEKTKKEQFADIKAFLDTIVSDKKLDDVNSFVIIKITNKFPLLNNDEIDVTIYSGTVKNFKYD